MRLQVTYGNQPIEGEGKVQKPVQSCETCKHPLHKVPTFGLLTGTHRFECPACHKVTFLISGQRG